MSATEQLPLAMPASPEPEPAPSPSPKRRKLRKGTQSCWECKRRKAKCTFSADTPDVCQPCQRRGSDCVSQEVTDRPPPAGSNKNMVDRLGRVEALVGQLLKESRRGEDPMSLDIVLSEHQAQKRRRDRSTSPARIGLQKRRSVLLEADWSESTSSTLRGQIPRDYKDGRHDACRQRLLSAWPSLHDLKIIQQVPMDLSGIVEKALGETKAGAIAHSPEAWLSLPPPASHPVLIARALLILATFLQGIPSSSKSHFQDLKVNQHEIMARAARTAHGELTVDDDLVASLEGVECIMLDGLYENYRGNLRAAWFAARRGIMIAQMLGLDQGVEPLSVAGAFIEPEDVWFRLVQFDRYLSLILGLPQSSPRDMLGILKAPGLCSPLERMHRLCSVAGGRLIQRDFSQMYDSDTTEEIDSLLQDATNAMPALWWVMPSLAACYGHDETLSETLRFSNHLMYYHLLLLLHFPYLLLPRTDRESDYNRTTAVTASREILSRLSAFRGIRSAGYYCPGIDFIIFVASTALCLTHIHDQAPSQRKLHFLEHQRQSDRGMLQQSLAIMRELVRVEHVVATTVATLLERLLAIEEDVAAGGMYTASFAPDNLKGTIMGFQVTNHGDDALIVHLPHLTAIKIERMGDLVKQTGLRTASSYSQPSWLMPSLTENAYGLAADSTDVTLDFLSQGPSSLALEDVNFSY